MEVIEILLFLATYSIGDFVSDICESSGVKSSSEHNISIYIP